MQPLSQRLSHRFLPPRTAHLSLAHLRSGDGDGVVPITGTRAWIHSLRLQKEEAWRDWRMETGQASHPAWACAIALWGQGLR